MDLTAVGAKQNNNESQQENLQKVGRTRAHERASNRERGFRNTQLESAPSVPPVERTGPESERE